ncbi:1-phosphatidylinositol-4,5-bisphosphate phosphodiesteras-like protein 1 [Pleomassaria siparia CBS 279.74]|uniref:Phosphoinositide phospholipase C n=1 Tax=Pleomassaria siparia CBS 279.74 TaxID=1314801 RepID=A0A6G1KC66_9PLEO|nr:1-phosphatidylinositol-4,5-bisphosphate phosphodiesteras-like protein 1 [Pleomassaria siparia CBS 279.74]
MSIQSNRPGGPSPQPSFRKTAAISIPSHARSFPSPMSTPSYYGINGSLQSTPECLLPVSCTSSPMPPMLHLPEPLFSPTSVPSPTSSPSAMSQAISKAPSLIRRVSHGAKGIQGKFRRAGSQARRDQSSGPVIMRRRSDSRTATDNAFDVSDLDLNLDDDDAATEDSADTPNALGISTTPTIPDPTVIAPVRNTRLETGTPMRKFSKGKPRGKEIILRLDFHSAKVFWDSSRPSKAFYVDDVREIRSGPEAASYRRDCGVEETVWTRSLWFTIVYSDNSRSKGKIRMMHLTCPDVGTFNLWTKTLQSVSRDRIDMMAGLLGFAEKSAKLVWQREMKKRFGGIDHVASDESMDLQGILELCRSLHINCSENTIRAHFQKADTNQSGALGQTQFLYFVRRLKERKDIKRIYKDLLPEQQTEMDKDVFFSFLSQEQGVDVEMNVQHWTTVFEKCARATKPRATPVEGGNIPLPLTMNFPAFQTYMSSASNSIYIPADQQLQHDRPLNEYFISSSHNTYLLGRQVAGQSSTEAYITALQKGCRCLEIDCWDGGDGKPIVVHGRTLTKSISFQDTVKVVNKYAFSESQYPLILSLEVHCCPEQQMLMVKTMHDEFRDKLVLQAIDPESSSLPPPQELMGKILIKVKAASETLDVKALTSELSTRKRDRSFSSPWSRPVQLNDNMIPNSPLVSTPPSMSPPERANSLWTSPRTSTTSTNVTIPTSAVISSAEDSDGPHTMAIEDKKKAKKVKTSKITKALGEMGVYTRGYKFVDFDCDESNTYNHVFSVNERTFNNITKPGTRSKQKLEEHNVRSLMRVYPASHRINSSNFEPLNFWRRGVQMVATNWQTYDLGQQLNEAMFAGGNDRTGYVLKPAELRAEDPSPVIGHKRAPKKEVKFNVDIISAQQLPRPKGLSPDANINPYVEFEMHCAEDPGMNAVGEGGQEASAAGGRSGIGNPLRKRTRIVEGNGYNPEFGDEITMTVKTRYPNLVFVRWTVWNSLDARTFDHRPLATFTAKLSNIQQGYHHLPLFDCNGEQYLFSTLFCKIKKQEIVDARPEPMQAWNDSRRSSMEPSSPLQESVHSKSKSSFVKRLISRNTSERRKRKDERTSSESKESDLDLASRSSTFER